MKCVSPSRRKTVGSSVIPAGIENSMSALAILHSLNGITSVKRVSRYLQVTRSNDEPAKEMHDRSNTRACRHSSVLLSDSYDSIHDLDRGGGEKKPSDSWTCSPKRHESGCEPECNAANSIHADIEHFAAFNATRA
jgi:hypothetical protein